MAFSAAAVPDTLGGAGVQFAPKDLEYAAEILGELTFNQTLRTQVIAGQRRARNEKNARLTHARTEYFVRST